MESNVHLDPAWNWPRQGLDGRGVGEESIQGALSRGVYVELMDTWLPPLDLLTDSGSNNRSQEARQESLTLVRRSSPARDAHHRPVRQTVATQESGLARLSKLIRHPDI